MMQYLNDNLNIQNQIDSKIRITQEQASANQANTAKVGKTKS